MNFSCVHYTPHSLLVWFCQKTDSSVLSENCFLRPFWAKYNGTGVRKPFLEGVGQNGFLTNTIHLTPDKTKLTMAMMLTDGGERIPDFYNESPDASLSQLSLDGSSPPVQLTPLGRQQEVTGPILTKEGLVAAIAELTAAKNAAVAEEDFEKAQYYKGQISQYQAVLKVGI